MHSNILKQIALAESCDLHISLKTTSLKNHSNVLFTIYLSVAESYSLKKLQEIVLEQSARKLCWDLVNNNNLECLVVPL